MRGLVGLYIAFVLRQGSVVVTTHQNRIGDHYQGFGSEESNAVIAPPECFDGHIGPLAVQVFGSDGLPRSELPQGAVAQIAAVAPVLTQVEIENKVSGVALYRAHGSGATHRNFPFDSGFHSGHVTVDLLQLGAVLLLGSGGGVTFV